MNWFKENKFVAGFFGAVVIAAGVLSFLLLGAKTRYADATAIYEEQAMELNRLQALSPYPEEKNLQAMEAQRNEHKAAIVGLQKTLNSNEIAIEPMTDVQFQDRLKETVLRLTEKAKEKGMALPEKFYLGFDSYEDAPPRPDAAPLLGRQLKAMEWVVMQLIDNRAAALSKITRAPLLEESETGKAPKGDRNPRADRGERTEKGGKSTNAMVDRQPFELEFTVDQAGLRNVLNSIVSSKTQFYIPSQIEIKNQNQKGPPRAEPEGTGVVDPNALPPPVEADPNAAAAATPPPAQPPVAAPQAKAAGNLKYIVGDEKVEVALRLEIVDFAEVSTK